MSRAPAYPAAPAAALVHAPRLETARLVLRGPEMRDFDAFAAFHADPARCLGFGPVYRRDEAWRWWASNIGHWHIRGYGYFSVEAKETGAACGLCGIWNPEGWPEPEVGWVVYEGYEGRGLAREAAERARAWAYAALGMTTLTSNIVPGNTRSVRLAERLGAVHERTYDNVMMGAEMLYRHPGPEDLA